MKKLEYVIQKEEGLHMKEAVEFVDMTEEFRSDSTLLCKAKMKRKR